MVSSLFIDTDIILDILLDRKEFFEDSSAIFKKFEDGEVLLFTSGSVIINAQYVGQKQIGKNGCRWAINYLLNYFLIIEPDINIIKRAYVSNFTDVEDAIQYYTATKNDGMDYFITRNIKDFKNFIPQLPVLTPTQFLKHIIQNP